MEPDSLLGGIDGAPAPGRDMTAPVSVCVIEDNDDVRSLLCRVLRDAGFSVSEARDGDEGIALAEQTKLDIVVTDIVMPNREGLETIKALKQRFPQIRILAISGAGETGPHSYLASAVSLGADDSLAKPFLLEDFVARVVKLAPARP